MNRNSATRVGLASIIGLVGGALLSGSSALSLSMIFMTVPVLSLTLLAWAGPIPAALCLGSALVRVETSLGAAAMLAAAVVFVIPVGVAWLLSSRRAPYFRSMVLVAVSQLGALLLVVLYLNLRFRMSVVDLLLAKMTEAQQSLPAAAQNLILELFGSFGLLTEETVSQIASGTLDAAGREEAFQLLYSRVEYLFKLTMPSILLTSSMLTGVLAVAIPTRIHVRYGDEPVYPHVSLHQWFIPSSTAVGLLVVLVTSYIIRASGVSGADSATVAIQSVVFMFFTLQGVAALDRMLRMRGWRRGSRAVFLALFTLFINYPFRMVSVIGALSMLFGRQGLVTLWLKKRQEEKDKEE